MLTVNEVIQSLEAHHQSASVCGVQCDGGSYRGSYDNFYIESGGRTTVGDLVSFLHSVIGESFDGYKGGSYTMDSDSMCFVASYGECGSAIIGCSFDSNANEITLHLDENYI